LIENEKDELFENSIQAYVQYPKELKQKGKKVAMKIISHAQRSYKSKLVKIWRNQDTPLHMYKDVIKDLSKSANQSTLLRRVSTRSDSDHRTRLATTSTPPVMLENRGSGNKRMKNWPSKVLRIHTTNSMYSWDHLCVLVLSWQS
jgi:hypothetical protein